MKKVSEGVLRSEINISQEQAQEFLESVNQRNYVYKPMGFIPTVEDWKNFLENWNQAIFDNLNEKYLDNYQYSYPEILFSKSCLKNGATEEEIAECEKRLQTKLPLSYKNFLLASNGFMIFYEDCELYGTDQIKWFIDENKDWAEIWDDGDEIDDETYLQYGEHQNPGSLRGEYMKTALQISSTEDGYVYLLNPQIKDSRNEWEAWDFGNKLPGADRYHSFWDMMQKVYERSLNS